LPFGSFNRTKITHRRSKFDVTKIMTIRPEELDPNPNDVASRNNQTVGSGITGAVYQAKWKNIPVAVKVFIIEDEWDYRGGMMEVLIMQDLRHPNILSIYGAYATSHLQYFVMEFGGKSFFHALHCDYFVLDWKDRIKTLMQIAAPLSYMHSFTPPLVHGDLRAANIILTNEQHQRNVRLIDFGFSFGIPAYWRRGRAGRRTAPEMVGKRAAMHFRLPAEAYAFAFVMFEVLTRSLPWEEYSNLPTGDIEKLVAKGVRFRIPNVTENGAVQGVPAGYIELMKIGWSQEPSLRPTLPEMLAKLIDLREKITQHEYGVR